MTKLSPNHQPHAISSSRGKQYLCEDVQALSLSRPFECVDLELEVNRHPPLLDQALGVEFLGCRISVAVPDVEPAAASVSGSRPSDAYPTRSTLDSIDRSPEHKRGRRVQSMCLSPCVISDNTWSTSQVWGTESRRWLLARNSCAVSGSRPSSGYPTRRASQSLS